MIAGGVQGALLFALRRRQAWQLARRGPVSWSSAAGPSEILTSIARVPERIGLGLRESACSVQDLMPGHYFYPAADLHVTITNLSSYQNLPLDVVASAVTGSLQKVSPLTLTLRGLALSRATVLVQVRVTPFTAMARLRVAIIRSLASTHRPVQVNPVLTIGHCNLIRFSHEAVCPAAHDLVERHQNTEFGSFLVTEIEIVRTDKVLSAAGTTVMAKCSMQAP